MKHRKHHNKVQIDWIYWMMKCELNKRWKDERKRRLEKQACESVFVCLFVEDSIKKLFMTFGMLGN